MKVTNFYELKNINKKETIKKIDILEEISFNQKLLFELSTFVNLKSLCLKAIDKYEASFSILINKLFESQIDYINISFNNKIYVFCAKTNKINIMVFRCSDNSYLSQIVNYLPASTNILKIYGSAKYNFINLPIELHQIHINTDINFINQHQQIIPFDFKCFLNCKIPFDCQIYHCGELINIE